MSGKGYDGFCHVVPNPYPATVFSRPKCCTFVSCTLFPSWQPAEGTGHPGMKWSILMCVWGEIPRTNILSGENR
jgi:hypothetical protein